MGDRVFLFTFYGRFLIANSRTKPTTMIAMIIPIIPGRMYRSAIDCVGSCVGCAVAAGSVMWKVVVAVAGES